ncbi:MAG: hypothetical protein IKF61_08830, partial [Firmicutes bacterium]|nr:hypothetical protein [Bacillota bacterium]
TVQNWETGLRKPPEYVISLLEYRVANDLINRKTIELPKYDKRKLDLPKRSSYISAISWLTAIQEKLGENVVFALDEALMCQGLFGGRNDEYLVWVYGDSSLTRFNGVVVLGESISKYDVVEDTGIRLTSFSRTLNDAFANEHILDMQGVTEALSYYYYSNNESFDGISVSPEYQEQFERLATDAINYYTY